MAKKNEIKERVLENLSDLNEEEIDELLLELEEASHKEIQEIRDRLLSEFDLTRSQVEDLVNAFFDKHSDSETGVVDFLAMLAVMSAVEQKLLNRKLEDYQARANKNNVLFDNDLQKQIDKSLDGDKTKTIDSLLLPVKCEVSLLYGKIENTLVDLFSKQIKDSANQTAFGTFKGLGVGKDITVEVGKLLDQTYRVNDAKWDDDLWYQKRTYLAEMERSINQNLGVADGKEKVQEKLNSQNRARKNNLNSSVRTDATYFRTLAQQEVYQDIGLDYVKFTATLDEVTCSVCGEHDGNIVPVDEIEPWENAAPLHYHCRCIMTPYFDIDNLPSFLSRPARNGGLAGKTYFVDNDITYEEWVKEHGI